MKALKFWICVVSIVSAAAAFGQAPAGRVYTYNPSSITFGTSTYEVNNTTVTSSPSSVTGYNQVTSATVNSANIAVNTTVQVDTYLYVSGNFAAYFEVSGYGNTVVGGNSGTNSIDIRTNRAFKIVPGGFGTLFNNVGTIQYQMFLYTTDSTPVLITQTGAQTDANFNGGNGTLTLTTNQIPSNGRMTLQITRALTLNGSAIGGQTYSVPGNPLLQFLIQ